MLCSGKWFRLTGEGEQVRALGRIYDPTGDNDRAPLSEIGAGDWGATKIEYRQSGRWEDSEHTPAAESRILPGTAPRASKSGRLLSPSNGVVSKAVVELEVGHLDGRQNCTRSGGVRRRWSG